jgi:hypothetical protein
VLVELEGCACGDSYERNTRDDSDDSCP